jgi:hypothetical protein
MASYSAADLVSALTGETPGFRESRLPTSKDILQEIYNPDADESQELLARLISPLKDELLSAALAKRAAIGKRDSGYV